MNILFNTNHLCSPFTHLNEEKNQPLHLSTTEKVMTVGLSILIGAFSYGIGGVIAFYVITAAIKAWRTRHSSSETIRESGLTPQKINLEDSVHPEPVKQGILSHFLNLAEDNPQTRYPSSIQDRRYPPLSPIDTMINFKGAHCHHTEHFYQDEEILELHLSKRSLILGERDSLYGQLTVDWTENDKVIIQQQAVRGCTAAVAAMLIYDEGKEIQVSSLSLTNLGNTDSIKILINEADLTPLVTILKQKDNSQDLLQELRQLLLENGSAIVSTTNDIESHVVVVDHISEDFNSVRLRDPFHGWEITVTQAGFLRGFTGGDIIQIAH